MHMRRMTSCAIGLTLGIALSIASPASADTAGDTPAVADLSSYDCVIVAKRILPGKPETRLGPALCEISERRAIATAAASFVLVAFYEHAKYNTTRRGRSTAILVESLCDSVGYRMSDLRDANNKVGGVSSYTYGTAGCNDGQIFYNTNFTGSSTFVRGDCPNVGTSFNDHLWSMRAWRYPCGC